MSDRLYIVAPTRFHDRVPDVDCVTQIYIGDAGLAEAHAVVEDMELDQFDAEEPDLYAVYELVKVPAPARTTFP